MEENEHVFDYDEKTTDNGDFETASSRSSYIKIDCKCSEKVVQWVCCQCFRPNLLDEVNECRTKGCKGVV